MNREHHAWYSERLGRWMDLLLFGHQGEPVLLIPTSKGRFFQYEDFGLIGAVAERVDAGRYMIMCVDSVDDESWYNTRVSPHDRVRRHEQYESYLLEEAIPLLRGRASPGRLTLGGTSFGGFHTATLGLRHPGVFQRLVSMSGKFDTDGFVDGHNDELIYYHSVFSWLPRLTDHERLEGMRHQEVILAAGEHDVCRQSNERLSALLWSKGVGNHCAIWSGAVHDWPVWKEMIRVYLPW